MGLRAALALLALAAPAGAETLRLATYDPALVRKGPGLLLQDIGRNNPQVLAAAQVIVAADADILLLTGFDWDYDGRALTGFADLLAGMGAPYPHRFAARPNRGMPTGIDMNGDGRTGTADDAQAFGQFSGQDGMALLSRLPLGAVTDHSAMLWRDLPGNLLADITPDPIPADAAAIQRLSTAGHWVVPVETASGPLSLLAFAATTPAFDGPEDRNGRRNHDEIIFWLDHLPDAPFVLMGKANLDPADGDGRHKAIRALLSDARLQDPQPRGAAPHDATQQGDPAMDTADWPEDGPGNLRVSYILPSVGLDVGNAAVMWDQGVDASPHRLVWVDVTLAK